MGCLNLIKRFLKFGIPTLIILGITAYLLLFFFAPVDIYVHRYLDEMETSTGKDIRVDKVDYYPLTTIVLRGLSVYEPNPHKPPFEAKKVKLKLKMLPLIIPSVKLGISKIFSDDPEPPDAVVTFPFAAELYGGSIEGEINLERVEDSVHGRVETNIEGIDLTRLRKIHENLRMTGILTGNILMEWVDIPSMENMVGNASFTVSDGELDSPELQQFGFQQIPFRKILADFRLDKSILHIERIDLLSTLTNMTINGRVVLRINPENSLLDLELRFVETDETGEIDREQAKITQPLLIRGTVEEPQIGL